MEPWFEILNKFGETGLFLGMLIVVVKYFYKELKEAKQELREMVQMTTLALERSTKNGEDTIAVMKKVDTSLEENTRQTSEFIAFQKGRDSR